jgi:hypothetical protein
MTRKSWVAVGLLGLIAATGMACDDDPTGPTGNVVIIYQDPDFRGDDQPVFGNYPDLDTLPGCGNSGDDWNDCISSIRVPSGFEVTVWEADNFEGPSMTFTSDVPNLDRTMGPCGDDWNDCISSMRVRER